VPAKTKKALTRRGDKEAALRRQAKLNLLLNFQIKIEGGQERETLLCESA
jgi:hypothetical protein